MNTNQACIKILVNSQKSFSTYQETNTNDSYRKQLTFTRRCDEYVHLYRRTIKIYLHMASPPSQSPLTLPPRLYSYIYSRRLCLASNPLRMQLTRFELLPSSKYLWLASSLFPHQTWVVLLPSCNPATVRVCLPFLRTSIFPIFPSGIYDEIKISVDTLDWIRTSDIDREKMTIGNQYV